MSSTRRRREARQSKSFSRDHEALVGSDAWLQHHMDTAHQSQAPRRSELSDPHSLHRLGVVCHHFGKHTDSIQLITEAIRGMPQRADFYHDLALPLRALGRLNEALAANALALRLQPRYAPAVDLQAQLLHHSGRTQEALTSYQELVDNGSASAEIHNNYGLLHHECGSIDDAVKQYETALRINPRQLDAYFNLSELARAGRYRFRRPTVEMMQRLSQCEDLDPAQYSRLCFSLAVAMEQVLDYDQAFSWYRQGNELVRMRQEMVSATSPHQRHLEFHALMEHLAERLQGKLTVNGVDRHWSPLFVMGMPRSGTTLLSEILASHPAVTNAGEADILRPSLEAFASSLAHQKATWQLTELTDPLQNVANGYLSSLAVHARAGHRYVVDKTPENLLLLGLICQLFPRSRVIWMQRDPRDVCWSCYSHSFTSERMASTTSDLEQIWQYADHCYEVGHRWCRGNGPGSHQIRYEELVARPEATLRQVFDFLELDWRDECLKFHEQHHAVQTASAVQVREPLNGRSIGGWQRYQRHLPACFARVN